MILGCGYTGRALLRRLVDAGIAVTATSRRERGRAAIEAAGGVAVAWELPTPVRADTAFVLFPPRGLDPDAVAAALRDVERVVYCSSTSVYGDRGGGWVEDDTEVAPASPRAEARVAAEAALPDAVIVRPAGIYGPARSIRDRVRAGRLRVTGDLERPINLIHVEDLAAILHAAAERAAPGDVILAASGRPIPWRALAEAACALEGVPLPAPTPLPEDPNLRMFYTEVKRCRPTKLERLGVQLRYPDVLAVLEEI